MAKSNNAPKNNTADQSKQQPLGVFVVDERQDRKFWTRVGAAWPHKDGEGFNVDITPGISVSGRLVIREKKQDDAQD
ncbi:hypothetical protein [Ancylobacter oerskovii]|uniref:Uncharacterized protein n=1 Tax=Ancylobacter oerskovii TaxID=459519 RepID=A0ABW4Z5J3_9HYPH|nr:hypothetical protein [Ancylobacter oerskovii]MBS7545545.1 hypothetical protein [Ancylobacter oerskovii]